MAKGDMFLEARTSIEVWYPAFEWEKPDRLFTVERTLSRQINTGDYVGGHFCLLCEGVVKGHALGRHVKAHKTEAKNLSVLRAEQAEKNRLKAMAEARRLKAENKRLAASV